MALINCPECGREISDRADFCPNCGCPLIKEPETATFVLKRESKALFLAVKYEVYLDYQLWGVLNNGDSLIDTLICGNHHLKIINKNNFNKTEYDRDFFLGAEGLTMTFSAATILSMNQSPYAPPSNSPPRVSSASSTQSAPRYSGAQPIQVTSVSRPTTGFDPQTQVTTPRGRRCPRCGGTMNIQTVSESRKSGCGTILLYIILALTILGLLIVIPLMLRKKTETVTYAVCQQCGFKKRV